MPTGTAFETEPLNKEELVSSASGRNHLTLAAGIGAVAVVTVFLWLIRDRYLPIVENWFSSYAQMMHAGKLPYKDFYFFTQPLSLLIAWTVYGIGDKVIYLRYYGFAERMALTGSLYFLLSRRFSPAASFWATVVSVLVFMTYVTEAFFTYLVTCCLFLVLSLVFLHAGLKAKKRSSWYLLLAGVSASLSFLAKQSNGLFVTLAVLFLAAVLTRADAGVRRRQSLRQTLPVAFGWLMPQAGLIVWLRHYGLTDAYVQQVFRGAAASKGGTAKILFGFLVRSMTPANGIALVIVAFVLWRMRRRGWRWLPTGANSRSQPRRAIWILAATIAASASILAGFWLPYNIYAMFFARTSAPLIANVVFWCSLVASLVWLVKLVRGSWGTDIVVPCLLVGGFNWAYACGLSWDVQQQATLLLMALIVAIAYEAFSAVKARVKFIALLLGFICSLSWYKTQIPFEWDGWRDSISHTPVASRWPRLAGYQIDPNVNRMFDTILDDVAKYSKPGEPVFAFPFMPMFNFVPDRPSPTFALVHYWDVCPDYVAVADAQRVRDARPRVIVEMDFSEEVWRIHEQGFRADGVSGQRAIKAAIDELTSSGDYILQDIFLSPGYHDPVRVWVRVR